MPKRQRNSEKHLMFDKLLLKLEGGGGGRHTCKMEGGGRTGTCPWWEGWGATGFCPPPPLENEKRKGEYWPISAVEINRRNKFVL